MGGVCWNKKHKKWYAEVSIGQGNKIHGGVFKNELDAAKRVNEICEEHKIPSKNPGIKTYLEVVPNEDDKNKTVTQSANPMNGFKIAKNNDDDIIIIIFCNFKTIHGICTLCDSFVFIIFVWYNL